MLLLVTLIFLPILYILVNYCKQLFYWKNKGIKYVTPLPIFGNSLPTVLKKITLPEHVIELYNRYPNERYCGTFQYGRPILLLRDLNLIKRICIQEFDTFSDHPIAVNPDDPLWGKNLFASSGARWKQLRQTLNPLFTPNKQKSMFSLMEDCATQLIEYLDEHQRDVVELELKDLFKRYSADVISSAAFGIKCNSFKDQNNDFIRMGMELTNFGGVNRLRRLLYVVNDKPILRKMLRLKMHPDNVKNFFRKLVKSTIDIRENENIVRHDLIQHLLDARKGQIHFEEPTKRSETEFAVTEESNLGMKTKQNALTFDDDDITAQALDFFYGGFYSTSALMFFTIHELVLNQEIQEKLRDEIDKIIEDNEGKISYDILSKMAYMDMVISETLRKWPTATWIDRTSHKTIVIEPELSDEKLLHLESGTTCWIPVAAIHWDEKYWPNPEIFDPERFNHENRFKINKAAFLPFGIGPRNCIGSRFAITEAKLVLFYILSRYEIVPTPKSFENNQTFLTTANSFWFGFRRRSG